MLAPRMRHSLKFLPFAATLMLPLVGAADTRSSPIILSPDRDLLAVVNADSRSVTLVSLPGEEIVTEIFVGRSPQTASFTADGSQLYVANRLDDSVSVIDVSAETRIATIPVCDEPTGIVIGHGERGWVSCRRAATIAVIDLSKNTLIAMIETERDPYGLALSPVTEELYVTHFSSGQVSVVNAEELEVETVISTGLDSNLTATLTISADGAHAWVPQTRSNASNEALLFDTTVFPVVSSIDLQARQHLQSERIFLDISDTPVNMPFDTAVSGNHLFVLNAGSNDLSVIDLDDDRALAHIEVGDHPRGMALDEARGKLYVNNTLAGAVSVIDLNNLEVTGEIPVTTLPLSTAILNGKKLFHSSDRTDLARDQWISCATCHFEGEMDGRTWFFPDGPRNTTSLLGVADTLPVHWSGDLDELQDVEATIRDIQAGTGLADGADNCSPACDQAEPNAGRSQDLDDLAAFMASLRLPPNPNRESGGSLSAAAQRGKMLFESAESGCATCHLDPLYSDALKHDVGTGDGPDEEKGSAFDTPSLRGIYKTAPYLHDGSAPSLMDVLTTSNPGDAHGTTSHLTVEQRQDLVAFMRSIGGKAFTINSGLNDAWVNASTPFQGLFITVFPDSGLLFLAWFTFDSVIPGSGSATFGARDQRWVTALGPIDGDSASLKAELTTGGRFNRAMPLATQDTEYGTIEVEFTDCRGGVVRYDFPSVALKGEFPITRVVDSNVGLCEALTLD